MSALLLKAKPPNQMNDDDQSEELSPAEKDRLEVLKRELETFRGKPYGNAFEALIELFGENREIGTFVCFATVQGEKPAILANTDSDPDPDAAYKLVRKLMRHLKKRTVYVSREACRIREAHKPL
jgi:hypothetical protein